MDIIIMVLLRVHAQTTNNTAFLTFSPPCAFQVTHTALVTPSVLQEISGASLFSFPRSPTATSPSPTAVVDGSATVWSSMQNEEAAEAANAQQVAEIAAASACSPFRRMVVNLLTYFAETYWNVRERAYSHKNIHIAYSNITSVYDF
jgi:hypothetical protein